MFWTIFAMLLLVATGGFISYYGDLQGRRWGKRRVSWFGLRPKHTAILITSLTGAVIAFLSVAAVIIVAPDVRHVVLQGERAINDNRRIREETNRKIEELQVKLKRNAAQIATNQETLEATNKQVRQGQENNDALKRTNDDLEKRNGGLVNGNMELQRQRALLQRSIDKNHQQLAVQKKEIADATFINTQLVRHNTDLGRQIDAAGKERTRLLEANNGLKEANQKLRADNEKLASDNSKLKMTYEAANNAYNNELDAYNDLKSKERQANESVALLKAQSEDLTHQRDELQFQLAGASRDLVRTYVTLRQTRYNLRADTELARRTLDAHLSPSAAREEVMSLLKDASDRARQYGASVGDNGRAVVIVSKRVVTPASVQMADESASVSAIVDAIAGSNTPVVVVARAINNSAANEQVVMELTSYTSVTVFKPGEVVASREVDSRLPMDKVVESVIHFLKEDVRNAAIKSGTIPQISPETGEEEVGMIDTPEMVALVERIRRTGGRVMLTAVANESLTSADLLTFGQSRGGTKPHNLRFDLKRVSGRAPRPAAPAVG
jgi:uncharacterized protein (DUF3084 family)